MPAPQRTRFLLVAFLGSLVGSGLFATWVDAQSPAGSMRADNPIAQQPIKPPMVRRLDAGVAVTFDGGAATYRDEGRVAYDRTSRCVIVSRGATGPWEYLCPSPTATDGGTGNVTVDPAIESVGNVSFFTAADKISGEDNLHWDSLTNSLGILTGTSPANTFAIGSGSLFQIDSSGRVFLPAGASGAGNLALSTTGDINTGLYFSAADEMRLQTGGSDRVTIDASGNVGIGVTAPQAFTEIRKTSGALLKVSSEATASFAGFSQGEIASATAIVAVLNDSAARFYALEGLYQDSGTGPIYGTLGTVYSRNTSGTRGDMAGGYFTAIHDTAGTVSNMTALTTIVQVSGGSVGTLAHWSVTGANITAGTITNAYQIQTGNFTVAGGAVTNAYGIYLGAISGGSSLNYQLYSSGTAPSFFNGNVGIGDASPLAALTVGSGDLFRVTSAGAISAATGITSSGTITFSAFTSNGGPLYTNGSGVLAQATAGTTTQVLHGGATPSFSAISLTADVSGTLPVANGGTGATTLTGVVVGNGTSAFTGLGTMTNGQLLIGDGDSTPNVAALSAGTNVTITNGAGSIIVAASGNTITRVTTAINYTALSTDYYIGCTANGITISLPTAASAGNGRVYVIKDQSGTASGSCITIDPNGSETIDNATTYSICSDYEAVSIVSDGSEWWIW